MAQVKTCDICGKIIKEHKNEESFIQSIGIGLSKFFGGTKPTARPALIWELDGRFLNKFDLCHDCSIELCKWVEKMQNEWKENAEV